MLLIADSGSTKCDWILVENDVQHKVSTMGFNPYFHSSDIISAEILKEELLRNKSGDIKEVYYYGAGAANNNMNNIVKNGLSKVFKNAQVNVGHDLDGAVFATCDEKPGIVCILGTGSNACYYDGNGNIEEKISGLGYILGDEGSGAYFGKRLLIRYLYGKLPIHIHKAFSERYNDINKQVVMENVYLKPHANVYLASFMKFLSDHRDDEFVRNFIYKGFSEFITTHVWKFENYREVPVHFIGSIAYYFQDLLREEARIHHLTIGKIVKQPVFNLVKYHTKASVSEA